MTKFRQMLLGTVAAGLLGSVGVPAFAGEVEKTMSVSGHINRAVVVSDNGENTTVSQIDNTSVSGSRFRIVGSAKSSSMTISTTMELGVQRNGALGSHATGGSSVNIRHSYISLANNMGTFSLGHTGVPDSGLTSSTLSGTSNAGFYDDSVLIGEEIRVSGNTGTASSGVTGGSILVDFINSRANVIKYQTPNMGGFSATVGFNNADYGAGKVAYSADYDGTKVVATVGWGSRGATSAVDAVWGGSMAISLAGGLNGSIAYSQRDLNNNVTANSGLNDPEMIAGSIGYKSGANGITAWYQQVKDVGANNNEAETFALVLQHVMADYGATVYGGIQNVDYSTTAIRYDDLTAGWVGIKVTF